MLTYLIAFVLAVTLVTVVVERGRRERARHHAWRMRRFNTTFDVIRRTPKS